MFYGYNANAMARLQNRTRPVGEALSLPQCTQQSGSLNGIMCVGVANLATRAATPLAGGYEPPLRVRIEIWKLLQNRTRSVGEALSLPQ